MGKVNYTVRKTLELKLKDGIVIELGQDEAEEIRDVLLKEYPPASQITKSNSVDSKPDFYWDTDSEKVTVEVIKKKPIPTGFTHIFTKESEPRNGMPKMTYLYFKDLVGNYAFQVKNHHPYPFIKLGKIKDPQSLIGRCLRQMPNDKNVNREWFKKNHVVHNNQIIKAVTDILEYLGYIERAPPLDMRMQIVFRRTGKIDGLEDRNNHEPLEKALVSSSPQK